MANIVKLLEDMLESVTREPFRSPEDSRRGEEAKSLIRYLLRQEESDYDRVDPEADHQAAWRRLKPLMVLHPLKPFLYHKFNYQDLATRYGDVPPSPTKKSLYNPARFPNWGPEHFFKHLHTQVASDTRLPDRDRYYLMLALRLLEVSARLPALHRNPVFERKVWRHAHAQVKALGHLNDFTNETNLKQKVEKFLSCQ